MNKEKILKKTKNKEVCAQCQHYRWDDTCSQSGCKKKPKDSCKHFFKRIEVVSAIVIVVIVLLIAL